jgi:3-deoxy-D-manno-octulosonic-acid transferase
MNSLIRIPYGAAGAVTRLAIAIAPDRNTKFLKAISGRRGLLDRYESWAKSSRDVSRPLLWMHAPSVGEGLQALPVVIRFREQHPNAQVVFTYFSPSAERFAQTVGADFTDYLPFDTASNAARAIEIIRPTAIVFSKLDVWPVLVERAASLGIKTALLSATVPESSRRRSGVALMALRDAYAALDVVGAIAPGDAQRLLEMGVRSDRITVTGDTRYDQVWAKASTPSAARDELVERFSDPRPTLVAGSTWPGDEKRLLPAWVQTRRLLPAARLIIAPHELTPDKLESIEQWAAASKLTLSRTSEPTARATEVVLVDQYGILADLYSVATAAYVGGGFHDAGLHSLLEPAAFGAPVLMGPMHLDNRDAGLLISGGGAMRCSGPGDISARLQAWFRNPAVLARASASARRVVEAGIGAADRSAELVDSLFPA